VFLHRLIEIYTVRFKQCEVVNLVTKLAREIQEVLELAPAARTRGLSFADLHVAKFAVGPELCGLQNTMEKVGGNALHLIRRD
jgi:hypothetical protein